MYFNAGTIFMRIIIIIIITTEVVELNMFILL